MAELRVTSPDGRWSFDGDGIVGEGTAVSPDMIDFFEEWTFARFLSNDVLALAFESGQPWSEFGSYGDRYGGVQIMVRDPDGPGWTCMAIEYDGRRHDESFAPDDVAWHPRGVLAWVDETELSLQVLRTPRGPVPVALTPERDSDTGPYWSYGPAGTWRAVSVDDDGVICRAVSDEGVLLVDTLLRRCSFDDGATWEPLSDGALWDRSWTG